MEVFNLATNTTLSRQVLELEAAAKAFYGSNKGLAFGPQILGFAADGFAYGLLVMQISQWITFSHAKEKLSVRILVWYQLFLSTGYSCLMSRWMFNLFAYGFDVYRNFVNFKWVSSLFLVGTLAHAPVSLFFAHRAFVLADRAKWVLWVTLPLLALSTISCIIMKALCPDITVMYQYGNPLFRTFLLTWLTAGVAVNLTVTSVIIWALCSSRTKVQAWEPKDPIIKKIATIGLESQFPPTFFSVGVLISCLVQPQWHVSAFFICTPKVYAIAFLGMLNARHYLRRDLAPDHNFNFRRPSVARLGSYKNAFGNRGQRSHPHSRAETPELTPTEIRVQTETIQETYRLEPLFMRPSVNRDEWKDPSSYLEPDQDEGVSDSEGGGVTTVPYSPTEFPASPISSGGLKVRQRAKSLPYS